MNIVIEVSNKIVVYAFTDKKKTEHRKTKMYLSAVTITQEMSNRASLFEIDSYTPYRLSDYHKCVTSLIKETPFLTA